MTDIKAIETSYKGYRFRSRLEARWAVFFDALGCGWQYEPEGFELNAGRYLPDFKVEGYGWFEVKGDRCAISEYDWARLLEFEDVTNNKYVREGRGLFQEDDAPCVVVFPNFWVLDGPPDVVPFCPPKSLREQLRLSREDRFGELLYRYKDGPGIWWGDNAFDSAFPEPYMKAVHAARAARF